MAVPLTGHVPAAQTRAGAAPSPLAHASVMLQRSGEAGAAPQHTADLQGKLLSLEQYSERVVPIHLWTSCCPMCRAEVPNVVAA